MASAVKDFYKNSFEHLSEELIWINHLIHDYINSIGKVESYPKFEKFSGLYISDEEINTIINHEYFLKHRGSESANAERSTGQSNAQTLRVRIDQKIQNSVSNNVYLSLPELKKLWISGVFNNACRAGGCSLSQAVCLSSERPQQKKSLREFDIGFALRRQHRPALVLKLFPSRGYFAPLPVGGCFQ